MDDIKRKAIKASKWSILTQITTKAISPLIYVILARLLTPSDYGIVAVASMVISFSQIFWEAGLGKTLIQRNDQIETIANIVFWTNISLGFLIYLILFSISGYLADFFHNNAVKNVVRVQSLSIIISSFGSVQTALFQKKLDFKTLFFINVATIILPAFVSIPMAYFGYGYWTLVTSNLIGSLANVIFLWLKSDWKPALNYDISVAKNIFRFSIWVMLESLLGWFFVWVDSIFVGRFLGTKEMGLYRTGNYFINVILGVSLSAILPVAYSTFSNLNSDKDKLMAAFRKVVKTIAFIAIPVSFGIALVSTPLSNIIFGKKWDGINNVISFLILTHGISWIVVINYEVYRAIGKADIGPKVSALSIPVYTLVYYIGISKGLNTFLYARFGLATVMFFVHALIASNIIRFRIVDLFNEIKYILLSGTLMVVSLATVKQLVYYNDILNLFLCILIGVLSYLTVAIFEKKFVLNSIRIILRY